MTAERAEEMSKKRMYFEKVVAKRKKLDRPELVFALKLGVHRDVDQSDLDHRKWTDEMMAMVDANAGPDFPDHERRDRDQRFRTRTTIR